MEKKILFVPIVLLALAALPIACTLEGTSEVEFAKELMKESAEATKDASGLEPQSEASKDSFTVGEGLTIEWPQEAPPEGEPYRITLTFEHYVPECAPSSTVNGALTADVWFVWVEEPAGWTLTIHFQGDLTVTGEHAGHYRYDAHLTVEPSGEYSNSGELTIDGTVYQTG